MVDHLELLGESIDNSLNFSKHISKITEKVENRLDVLGSLKNTVTTLSKMCLYNSVTCCSAIWYNIIESHKH